MPAKGMAWDGGSPPETTPTAPAGITSPSPSVSGLRGLVFLLAQKWFCQHFTSVRNELHKSITELAEASAHTWLCPEFRDTDFLLPGVQWVLECSPSGRGFLQEHGLRFARTPGLVNYFAALRSARRCAVLREANLALVAAGNQTLRDRAAEALAVPRLRAFYVGL